MIFHAGVKDILPPHLWPVGVTLGEQPDRPAFMSSLSLQHGGGCARCSGNHHRRAGVLASLGSRPFSCALDGFLRTFLLGTSANKGKNKGRGTPALDTLPFAGHVSGVA
jgi:hypothetical protein